MAYTSTKNKSYNSSARGCDHSRNVSNARNKQSFNFARSYKSGLNKEK